MACFKRSLGLLLCAALLLALLCPALAAGTGEARFALSSGEAGAGETVELTLSLEENPGLISAALELEYDREALELVSAEDAGLLPNGLFSDRCDTYPFVMMWDASTAAADLRDSGVLATLRFRVTGEGGSARVWLSAKPENVYNYRMEDVPFALGEGRVTITGGEPAHEHSWGEPSYDWREDLSACTASRLCAGCGERESEEAPAVITEEAGKTVYTVRFTAPCFTEQRREVEAETPPEGPALLLSLSDGTAEPGGEVELSLRLENNPGVVSMLLELRYDRSRLELVAAEDAGLLPHATFSDHLGADPFILYWEDSTAAEDCMGNGLLAALRFRVLEGAAAGECPVQLRCDPENIYNAALENVPCSLQSGSVTIRAAAPGPAEPPAAETIRVSQRLVGDSLHGEGAHAAYVTWIPTTLYTLPKGTTAKELFLLGLAEAGLAQSGAESGFVNSVTAPAVLGGFVLANGDNGGVSGWMYTVNGKHPGVTLGDYVLEDGDAVIWHYCDDYTQEETPGAPLYGRWLLAADISPEAYAALHGGGEDPAPEEEPGREEAEPAAARFFEDVTEDNWFAGDVAYCVEHGLMRGTGETSFSPRGLTTRAMLVTVLYRLEGSPRTAGSPPFTDAAPGSWYGEALAWAAEIGLAEGYGDGRFGPDDLLTREQLVTLLYRYARHKGLDCGGSGELTSFTDLDSLSPFAGRAMRWAVAEGLIRGRGQGLLAPRGSAVRAELAAVLHRFSDMILAD